MALQDNKRILFIVHALQICISTLVCTHSGVCRLWYQCIWTKQQKQAIRLRS